MYRWSFCTGGPCVQVVLLYRWSLCTGGPCVQVVCKMGFTVLLSERRRFFLFVRFFMAAMHYTYVMSCCCLSVHILQEKELYWPPASTMEELYGQLSQKKYQEIPRNSLTVKDLLGEGEFGQVFYGEWLSSFGPVEVAVKVSNNADSEGRVKLLQEAAVMGQFLHPRVVRLHGVVTCDEPVSCVENSIEYSGVPPERSPS